MLKFFSKAAPAIALAALCLGHPIHAQDTVTAPLDATTPSSSSGIEDINKALEALSQELLLSLPPAGTYAIKNVDDATSGVPEALLTQISSSLSSSLMVASNFEMNLIDQSQQNSAWANAVEFNGADFEAMVAASDFSAMIVLNTRATNTGIEISLQAIGATSADAGQVIASTQVKMVQLNWAEFASADLTDSTAKKIDEIREQLEKLQRLDSPIPSPQNWIEFYSNAQKYAEKRNIDASINSLEKSLLGLPDFFDPVFDFATAVRSKYGVDGAQKYFSVRLSGKIKEEHEIVARLALGINDADIDSIAANFDANPVLAAVWFWGDGQPLLSRRDADFSKSILTDSIYSSYDLDFYLLKAIRAIVSSDMNGSLSNNFFDISLVDRIFRMRELLGVEEKISRVEYGITSVTQKFGQGDAGFVFNEAARPSQSSLVELRPLSILGQPWTSLDWAKFLDPSFARSNRGMLGICGLDLCDLDLLANDQLTLSSCKDNSYDQTQYEAEWASVFDANTSEINMADFEVNQLEVSDNERSMGDPGRLYTFDAPLIPPRYADLCLLADKISKKINGYNYIEPTRDGDFRIFGPSNLLITDDVDVTKPVYLTFGTSWGSEDTVSITVDITKDGTSVYNSGFPLEVSRYQDHEAGGSRFVKGWLYVPGWIESALFTEHLSAVSYTDALGRRKAVSNIFIQKHTSESPINQALSTDRLENFTYRWRSYGINDEKEFAVYQSPAKKFEDLFPTENSNENNVDEMDDNSQSSLVDFSSIGSCVNGTSSIFYPTNIDEYVSLRSDPSTEANILRKVFKGEKLESADQTIYFGANSPTRNQCYDLCKAESETGRINTSNLAICVNDNSLWLKLRTSDGVEGYISTKFLGVPTSDFSSSEGGAYEEGD